VSNRSIQVRLGKEEQFLSNPFGAGERKGIKDLKKGKTRAKKATARYLTRNYCINIRVSVCGNLIGC
jgi:predicted DNA binding CopG/RHH family protein